MWQILVPPVLNMISGLLIQKRAQSTEAKHELEWLQQLMVDINEFLKRADSEEVIDGELSSCMNRALKFLYDVEDTVNEFERSRSKSVLEVLGPSLVKMFKEADFANEAKRVRQTVKECIDKWKAATSNVCAASLFTNDAYTVFNSESDHKLVNIESARDRLVRWLTENDATAEPRATPEPELTQSDATSKPEVTQNDVMPPKSEVTPNGVTPTPKRVVLAVHGAPGVGKTALVGSVLRDPAVRKSFAYVVWMTEIKSCEGTENAFTQKEIENATAKTWKLSEPESEEVTVGRLENKIRGETNTKWLLVLDDLDRPDLFESILKALPIRTRPSIIVTTRDSCVASLCVHRGGFGFKPEILSEDHSRTLFVRQAFPVSPSPDDFLNDFKEVLERIIKLCNGLPLAIHAISSLLSSEKRDPCRWEEIIDMLGQKLTQRKNLSLSIKRMVAIPRYLPSDVKVSLHYLSIFPSGLPVSCSEMMHLWMAEGFFEEPLQKVAVEWLESLVRKNLIHVEEKADGRLRTCRVDNILHQIITLRSKDVGFTRVVDDLWELLDEPDPIWRLSFSRKMKREKKDVKKKKKDLKQEKGDMRAIGSVLRNKPRSLFLFEGLHPDFMGELLKGMKMLKVFVLKDPYLNKFPEKIVDFHYLRYLSLRNSSVKAIPSSIENLINLETLDLKGSRIAELPSSIKKLKKLRHLLLYRSEESSSSRIPTKSGFKAPSEVGTLTSLEKLCFVNVDSEQSKSILQELEKLKELQRLGVLNLREEDGQNLCSSIGVLEKLEALNIVSTEGEAIDLSALPADKLPKYLQRISLMGHLKSLPEWIPSVTYLKKLVLKGSKLGEDPAKKALDSLERLTNLMHLELEEAFLIETMTFQATIFRKLRFLGVYKFDRLKRITIEDGALPALQRLSLLKCPLLETLLPDITRPSKLKRFEHCGFPEEFIRAIKAEIEDRVEIFPIEWKDDAVEISSVETTNPPRRSPFPSGKLFQSFFKGASSNSNGRSL